MDNRNSQNNFPGNQKDCPGNNQAGKNPQNKNKNNGQQKKDKKEEF